MERSTQRTIGAAMVVIVTLSSCAVRHDELGHRYEHGDRIAADERRDVGWCLAHASNEHCRTSVAESP